MSVQLEDRLLESIETALIEHGAVEETYDHEVASLDEVKATSAALVVDLGSPVETLVSAHQLRRRVLVTAVARSRFGQTDRPRREASRLRSDVLRAVLADRTRDGDAIDTLYVRDDPIVGDAASPYVWVAVEFELLYQTSLTDPNARP